MLELLMYLIAGALLGLLAWAVSVTALPTPPPDNPEIEELLATLQAELEVALAEDPGLSRQQAEEARREAILALWGEQGYLREDQVSDEEIEAAFSELSRKHVDPVADAYYTDELFQELERAHEAHQHKGGRA